VRRIVHLKLSAEFPPEVREAAVIQEEDGRCSAVLKLGALSGPRELVVPLVPCEEFDPAQAVSSSGAEWAERLSEPAYRRLMEALRRLSRSME